MPIRNPEPQINVGDVFRHYKGDLYMITDPQAINCSSDTRAIAYVCISNSEKRGTFFREPHEFFGDVEYEIGNVLVKGPRFALVGSTSFDAAGDEDDEDEEFTLQETREAKAEKPEAGLPRRAWAVYHPWSGQLKITTSYWAHTPANIKNLLAMTLRIPESKISLNYHPSWDGLSVRIYANNSRYVALVWIESEAYSTQVMPRLKELQAVGPRWLDTDETKTDTASKIEKAVSEEQRLEAVRAAVVRAFDLHPQLVKIEDPGFFNWSPLHVMEQVASEQPGGALRKRKIACLYVAESVRLALKGKTSILIDQDEWMSMVAG